MTNADARQELQRIAASEAFREAESLRRLLLYLGEETLEGRAEQLKEYTVGVEALGRPAHYDPRVDSSGRMLASRLRRKLEDYYRGEGAASAVRVGFPKGGFRLTFEAAAVPRDGDKRWKLVAGLCAAGFLVATLALVLVLIRRPAAPALAPELEALWRPLFENQAPAIVSFGSPLFVSSGGWNVRWSGLNDWQEAQSSALLEQLSRAAGGNPPRPVYYYAGIGDVHGAFLMARLLAARNAQLTLKRGMVLSWEDIQHNHLVFIGNGKNQEKLRYLLRDRDFSLEDGAITNLNPRAGEQAVYPNVRDSVEFGLITSLPSSERGRHMMILSAGGTEAIWGTVEAVTNPRFAGPLVARLRGRGAMPRAYQAVIRLQMNAGVPVSMSYVTHHEVAERGSSK